MKKIIYLYPAKEEMIEAAEYYERQSPNLGRDFYRKSVRRWNESGEILSHGRRRMKT